MSTHDWRPGMPTDEIVKAAQEHGGDIAVRMNGGQGEYRIESPAEVIADLKARLAQPGTNEHRQHLSGQLERSEQAYELWQSQMTNEYHYADAEKVWEGRLRADYAHVYFAGAKLGSESVSTEQFFAITDDIDAVRDAWQEAPAEARQAWAYLDAVVHDWRHYPDTMRRASDVFDRWHHQGLKTLDGVQWRSQQQAKELTGNGFMQYEPFLADIARHKREGHLAEPGTSAPVNAFATAAAAEHDSERDGAER
ncbi:hypothetical protein [Nocardia sp. NPDC004722]